MPISTSAKYGVGREATPGTAVAPGTNMDETKGGVPMESFAHMGIGDEISIHSKFLGLPFDTENSRIRYGKAPVVPNMEHNVHFPILGVLLASFTPYSLAVDLATIKPGADGIHWEFEDGTPSTSNMTFTTWYEFGVSGDAESVSGCVCDSLQLTFPQGGGPVRMSWTAVGMDSSQAASTQTAANYGYPSVALIDHIASDFEFFLGAEGAPVQFYPDGDVVITFTPVLQVQKRCSANPRIISISRYAVTAEFTWPWDATSDVHDRYDDFYYSTRKHLTISNATAGTFDTAPNTAGEFTLHVLGSIDAQPVQGGDGILGERSTITGYGESAGGTYDWPYVAIFFDDTTFDAI